MKSFTVLLLAGFAVATKGSVIRAAASGNSTDVNTASGNSTAEAGNNNVKGNNTSDVIQVQNGQQCINVDALNDPNFDPASLDLGNMNMGGLNLGSVNLADPISLAFGIDTLLNGFCLGQLVDLNSLLALGVNNEAQMFLELAQIAQLQSIGLLNGFGAQNLIQSNLLFGGAFNVFNSGIIKRDSGAVPATLRVRRAEMAKRQCNLGQQQQQTNIQNLPPCQNENNNGGNQADQNVNGNADDNANENTDANAGEKAANADENAGENVDENAQ